jgi:hypothetical protein
VARRLPSFAGGVTRETDGSKPMLGCMPTKACGIDPGHIPVTNILLGSAHKLD